MPTTPDRLLTSHEVGHMLQMDPSSVVAWVNRGILPAYRTPGGHRRIRSSEPLRFLRDHKRYIPHELESGVRGASVQGTDWLPRRGVPRLDPLSVAIGVRIVHTRRRESARAGANCGGDHA